MAGQWTERSSRAGQYQHHSHHRGEVCGVCSNDGLTLYHFTIFDITFVAKIIVQSFYPGGGEEGRGGEGGQRDEGAELQQSPKLQTL